MTKANELLSRLDENFVDKMFSKTERLIAKDFKD